MWYLGGKCRQAKQIVAAIGGGVNVRYLGGKKRQAPQIVRGITTHDFRVYVEPFCGALWSAVAIIKAFPGRRYLLNDINPHLICLWEEARKGWNPPERVSEATYAKYNRTRPLGDPMTGYVGFAWSFGGKFFGGAARTNGLIKGSYKSTRDKIDVLRSADVRFSCGSYETVKIPDRAAVYLDPPYEGRTHQSRLSNGFDYVDYCNYADRLAKRCFVIATSFTNESNWVVLHNYGDTVVRHHSAATKGDGTVELLMRVS